MHTCERRRLGIAVYEQDLVALVDDDQTSREPGRSSALLCWHIVYAPCALKYVGIE